MVVEMCYVKLSQINRFIHGRVECNITTLTRIFLNDHTVRDSPLCIITFFSFSKHKPLNEIGWYTYHEFKDVPDCRVMGLSEVQPVAGHRTGYEVGYSV